MFKEKRVHIFALSNSRITMIFVPCNGHILFLFVRLTVQRYNFFLIYANIFVLFLLFTVNPICQRSNFITDTSCVVNSSITSLFPVSRLLCAFDAGEPIAHNDPSGGKYDVCQIYVQLVRLVPAR